MKSSGKLGPIIMQLLVVFVIFAIFYKFIIPRTSTYYRYVFYEPRIGVYLTERDVVMVSGESFRLGVRTVNKRLTFSSTDFKVAFVNKLGKVTAYHYYGNLIRVAILRWQRYHFVETLLQNLRGLRLSLRKRKEEVWNVK